MTLIYKKRMLNSNYKATFLYDRQLPEMNKVIFTYIYTRMNFLIERDGDSSENFYYIKDYIEDGI